MPTATELGQTGLQGWREKVADGLAEPVAQRAPLDAEQVRATLGALFFVLSLIYVVKTVRAAARQARPRSPKGFVNARSARPGTAFLGSDPWLPGFSHVRPATIVPDRSRRHGRDACGRVTVCGNFDRTSRTAQPPCLPGTAGLGQT